MAASAMLVAAVVPTAGCAALRSGGAGEAVSATVLQKDIAERLTRAGQPPKSVSCDGPLAAEAGASTHCVVVLSDVNSIEPVVTLTSVEPPAYSVTPAVNPEQLARALGSLLSSRAVRCESGLDGKVGAQSHCEVTKDGTTMTRTVDVTNVEGLLMSYVVLPVLSRQQVQDLVAQRLTQGDQRPQRVDCGGDLQGKPGSTLECVATTGGQTKPLLLTVSTVKGDVIDFGVSSRE